MSCLESTLSGRVGRTSRHPIEGGRRCPSVPLMDSVLMAIKPRKVSES
jgi:hypothetical protein